MINKKVFQYLSMLILISSALIYFLVNRHEIVEVYNTDLGIRFEMPKVWFKKDLDGYYKGVGNIWLIVSDGYLGFPANSTLYFYRDEDNRDPKEWVENFIALKKNRMIINVENTFIGNENVLSQKFTYCDNQDGVCEVYLIKTDKGVFFIDVRIIRNSESKERAIKNIFDSMEFEGVSSRPSPLAGSKVSWHLKTLWQVSRLALGWSSDI